MMRKCLIFLETNLVFSMLSGQATFLFLVENHLTARALAEANDQCSALLSQVSRRKISKRCRYLSVAKSRVDLPLSKYPQIFQYKSSSHITCPAWLAALAAIFSVGNQQHPESLKFSSRYSSRSSWKDDSFPI